MSRARDIQTLYNMKGAEKASRDLITELFEIIAQQRQQLRDLSVIQLEMARQMEMIVQGANGIRKEVEKMQRVDRNDDNIPRKAT